MSIINGSFSGANALGNAAMVGQTDPANDADKKVTYVFTPAELGAPSGKNAPATAQASETQIEKALFKHFGLNVDDPKDAARIKQLLDAPDSPFNAVKTNGDFTAVRNQKTGNYEIPGTITAALYDKLSGKAAAVKAQVEAERQQPTNQPAANPNEAVAAKTGGNINDQRAALEAKLAATTEVSPMSAKHGITPELAAADKEAAKVWLAEAGKTVNGAANAYMEDQFMMTKDFYNYWNLTTPDESDQNAAGRLIGHGASGLQSIAEIVGGGIGFGGGTILDASGVGAVAGVPAQVASVGLITHGVVTGANTINNVNNDSILNMSADATASGGTSSAGGASRTQPSMPPDSTRKPKGVAEDVPTKGDPSHIRSIQRQNESADLLSQTGYDVEYLPQVKGEKSPDFMIEGKKFDCYSPSKNRAFNIFTEISDKVSGGQTKRIVLNLEDSPASLNELKEAVETTPLKDLEEIIVIKNGKATHFFPFE